MISKRKAGLVLIVIFTMIVNFTAQAFDQDMTRHIENTDQDVFVLETGVAIDANFMTVLSPDMDIRGMLFFEDIKINSWEVLINATLRLRTFHGRSFDAESKITIYGVRDYGGFGYSEAGRDAPGSPSAILGLPLTDASVNYNTSQFYGSSWKEIDVTSLVNEMKSDRNYDGPGLVVSNRGGDMIFMIFGTEGHEPRSFYDFRAGNNLEAQLVLHWTDSPPPPPGGAFNESYRGLNIFEIDHNGENRTGEGMDVNWNKLSMTQLTEIDSGNAITVHDATRTSLSAFVAQQVNALFNDTGGLGVSSFFVRFALNVTGVFNPELHNDVVATVVSVGTATPVGGGGLFEGGAGDKAGVAMWLDQDNERFLFRLWDRSGGLKNDDATTSEWLDEDDDRRLYFEYVATDTWQMVSIYLNPDYSNLLWTDVATYVHASGPFRYTMIIASTLHGTHVINKAEIYTFLTDVLPENKTWTVALANGTLISEDCPTYDCAIIFIDDLLGVDPDEPAPAGQGWPETGVLTRFRTRFYILFIGFIMIFGPLISFSFHRPDGYTFTIGLFIMLIGFSLWIAAGSV